MIWYFTIAKIYSSTTKPDSVWMNDPQQQQPRNHLPVIDHNVINNGTTLLLGIDTKRTA